MAVEIADQAESVYATGDGNKQISNLINEIDQ